MPVENARGNPLIELLGVKTGAVAFAKITSSAAPTAVNFATAFRDKAGVVDLTGKSLRMLVIANRSTTGTIGYQLDGCVDGGALPQILPLGASAKDGLPGYSTDVELKIHDGTAAGATCLLWATYDTGG